MPCRVPCHAARAGVGPAHSAAYVASQRCVSAEKLRLCQDPLPCRTVAFMTTILPNPRPRCYARNFPPVPDTVRGFVEVGFSAKRGSGCNDLVRGGRGRGVEVPARAPCLAVGARQMSADAPAAPLPLSKPSGHQRPRRRLCSSRPRAADVLPAARLARRRGPRRLAGRARPVPAGALCLLSPGLPCMELLAACVGSS